MKNHHVTDRALVEIDGNSAIVNNDHHITLQDAALRSYVFSLIDQAMDRRDAETVLMPEDIPHVLERFENEGLAGVLEELDLPPPGTKTFAMDVPIFATIRINAASQEEAIEKAKELVQIEIGVEETTDDVKKVGELSPVATTAADMIERLRNGDLSIWEE
tara:strand:+ start:223 stop:705 length:483 start_codon:yes stop_codon:yes gene_type:complete